MDSVRERTVNSAGNRTLDSIDKNSIVSKSGVSYRKFKADLKPRFKTIWLQLFSGHLTLAAIAILIFLAEKNLSVFWLIPVTAAAAVGIGYVIAYIVLFFHEAAHFNLARERKNNDLLANLAIGCFLGQNIKEYRIVHFDHHRFLGQPNDTENTYFDPLNARFIAELLLGIKPLKVILKRKKFLDVAENKGKSEKKSFFNIYLLFGIAFHIGILSLGLIAGTWSFVFAWIAGVGIFFPLFSALRQLLEHRDEKADANVDYTKTPHGAATKMFGSNPFAATFGGAGFNHHLLHHWDPQISCSNLHEVKEFLLETEAGEILKKSQTGYVKTFVRLFNN